MLPQIFTPAEHLFAYIAFVRFNFEVLNIYMSPQGADRFHFLKAVFASKLFLPVMTSNVFVQFTLSIETLTTDVADVISLVNVSLYMELQVADSHMTHAANVTKVGFDSCVELEVHSQVGDG